MRARGRVAIDRDQTLPVQCHPVATVARAALRTLPLSSTRRRNRRLRGRFRVRDSCRRRRAALGSRVHAHRRSARLERHKRHSHSHRPTQLRHRRLGTATAPSCLELCRYFERSLSRRALRTGYARARIRGGIQSVLRRAATLVACSRALFRPRMRGPDAIWLEALGMRSPCWVAIAATTWRP